ncbi:hypothetical protein IG631_18719 [Alternaria alternata]|nr:hypothetical protein IG631_18719 [Alternaria alternata]
MSSAGAEIVPGPTPNEPHVFETPCTYRACVVRGYLAGAGQTSDTTICAMLCASKRIAKRVLDMRQRAVCRGSQSLTSHAIIFHRYVACKGSKCLSAAHSVSYWFARADFDTSCDVA